LSVGRFETMSFQIIAADHTGITVSNLERSLAFWRDVLGFELSHRPHQSGKLASEITGVAGAEISIAVLKGYGHKIELLEYLSPADRKRIDLKPCDVGSVHVAFTVDNLDATMNSIAASGWKAAGKPQTITVGPNTGKRVVYVRDPDGTTIEFMETPKRLDG
jgi:catechol 2,3-dioxygenase-like lactoylglutathione lyase family enzyme